MLCNTQVWYRACKYITLPDDFAYLKKEILSGGDFGCLALRVLHSLFGDLDPYSQLPIFHMNESYVCMH